MNKTTKFLLGLVLVVVALTSGFSYHLGFNAGKANVLRGVDPADLIKTVFTPREDGTQNVLDFLDKAPAGILIADYTFNNDRVINKLIELHQHHHDVRILLDKREFASVDSMQDACNRLRAAHIPYWIGTSPKKSAIMHEKFIVLIGAGVLDGSWNITGAADDQANNFNIVFSKKRAEQFADDWQYLYDHISKQKQP